MNYMDVLIIEDDVTLAKHVEKELSKLKHTVTVCHSIREAIDKNYAINHDIVILDLLLNGEHGIDFVRYVQKENLHIPILVLSSLAQTINKVELLKAGVDDYMTKPFEIQELSARLEALHRRYIKSSNENTEKHDGIEFLWDENRIIRDGKDIFLTKKECKLLKKLVINKGKVIKSEDILKYVWNVGPGYHSNILQSLVRHLRKRIDADFDYKLIKNIHGVGYMLTFPKDE